MRTVSIHIVLSLALASSTSAEVISGRVVDSSGNGVVGIDIDVLNNGSGGDPDIFNDGTDPSGFFTTTVIPPGVYDIRFTPPAPPATTHLPVLLTNVAVVGSINLGVITLPAGVSVSGRAVDSNGLPAGGVSLGVFDAATGQKVLTRSHSTNAFGNFSIAVPPASIELRFDASKVIGRTLVSKIVGLFPSANTNLGDVVLPVGFLLSGTVQRTSGTAVANADIDVQDITTGVELYTPGDNTNALGVFSFAVPAGTWEVQICPSAATALVAGQLDDVVVSANTNVGVIQLQTGVTLFGTVTDSGGLPVPLVDIDVMDTVTGQEVPLCGGGSNASGVFSFVVPIGVLDVEFSPGFQLPLGAHVESALSITSNTLLNAALPDCPFGINYGTGLAGTGGFVPHLTTSGGAPRIANLAYRFELEEGLGGAPAVLIISLGQFNIPLFGGTMLVDFRKGMSVRQTVILGGASGVGGEGSAPGFLPRIPIALSGVTLYSQFFVLDTVTPAGLAMSEGLQMAVCP